MTRNRLFSKPGASRSVSPEEAIVEIIGFSGRIYATELDAPKIAHLRAEIARRKLQNVTEVQADPAVIEAYLGTRKGVPAVARRHAAATKPWACSKADPAACRKSRCSDVQ